MSFLTALLTITACFSLGQIVNSIIFRGGKASIDIEKAVFNIAIGAAALSFIVFFLGIFGFIYAAVFVVLLVLLNILSLYIVFSNKSLRIFKISKFNGFEKFTVSLILLAACAHVVLSFRPVTNLDALSHLVLLPKSYIFHHAIYNLSLYIPYSTYPQALGMLDMLVIALSNETAVNHLHLLIGFLTCAIIYVVGKKTANRTAGLIAVLTIITSSVFFDMTSIAKIDIGIALCSAMVLYALCNWNESKSSAWFYIAIAVCAFAFGVKYNGTFIIIFPAVFYAFNFIHDKSSRQKYLMLVPFSAVLYLLIISPWLLLNLAFTGNPMSPFLSKIFHDRSQLSVMTGSINEYFKKSSSGYFNYLKDVLLGMPVLFFAFFAKFRKNIFVALSFISGVLYFAIGNFFLLHADRIFFPAFIMLFFVVGYAVYGFLINPKKWARYTMVGIYLAMAIYGSYTIVNEIFRKENYSFFTGKETKTEFLKRDVTSYPITIPANKLIPRNEMLWSLAESRGYYFDQQFIQGFSYVTFDIIQDQNPDNIIAGLKKYNIKYVLFSKEPYFYIRQPAVFNQGKFLADKFDLIASEGYCRIYKLKS